MSGSRIIIAMSMKELNVGRTISILHATEMLVKGHMLCFFDLIGSCIKIQSILEGLSIAKEKARTNAVFKTAGTMSTGGKGRNFAAKGSKVLEIRRRTGTYFKAGESASAVGNNIVKTQVVMKSVWPELEGKPSAIENGAQRIFDGTVRTFTRTILMGRIRRCRFNNVPSFFEVIADISGFAQVTTKIHTDIFVCNIFATAMFCQPTVDVVDRRCFGSKGTTIKSPTEVISDKDIAGFTMKTCKTFHTGTVVGLLNNEASVNGQSLIANSGMARIGLTTSCLGKFTSVTNGTMLISEFGGRKRRDANSMTKYLGNATEVQMAESIVPE